MTFLLLLPSIFCFLVLAAHYLREWNFLLVGLCIVTPLLLLFKTRYVLRAIQFLLVLACLEWIATTVDVLQKQAATEGHAHIKSAVILGGVALFNLFSAALFQTPRLKARYPRNPPQPSAFPVSPAKQ